MQKRILWFLSLLWLALQLSSVGSRHIYGNNPERNETVDDDVDLEEVLADYYDSLLEIWGHELSKKEEEGPTNDGDEDRMKPKRAEGETNYDYVSDANMGSPQMDSNGTKSLLDLAVPIEIGNVTYRFLNESYAAILALQRANREKIKEMRLSSIKESVLSLRGGNSTKGSTLANTKHMSTLKDMFDKQVKDSPEWPTSNMYAEKYQSFYPSCDLPRNTDETLWADPYSMNLFFDVYFPTPQKETTLMIVSAILRLYTIPQANSTSSLGNLSIPGLRIQMDQTSVNIPNFSLLNSDDDDRQIRISVYWHTRSLRRQRVKKKLLGSQMMPLHRHGNLTFNIKTAVRSWKESGKNFGLLVTVEDEDGTLLKASNYIHPMNCSKWAATVRPLPLFGFDSPTQYFIEDPSNAWSRNGTGNETNYDDESSYFPNRPVKYPILGLRMMEVSQSELENLAVLKTAKMKLESGYYNWSRRGQRIDPRSRKSEDSTSRITFFENVPLGSPLTQNHGSKITAPTSSDPELKINPVEAQEADPPRIRHARKWEVHRRTGVVGSSLEADGQVTNH